VVEVRRGKKVTTERRFMPGYVLVHMEMSDQGYHLINSINRVTGFLGPQGRPMPMRDAEVNQILNRARETAGHQRWREIPVVGQVTAGLPMYAQEEWEGSVVLDAGLYHGQNLFALRIKGDSMQGAGILDGDLAICEPRQYAQSGEIVVALIHSEEATVKRFFLHRDCIELRPENPRYKPVRYGFDEVLVQGKVVGLQRFQVGSKQ
jgi:repressor LexA